MLFVDADDGSVCENEILGVGIGMVSVREVSPREMKKFIQLPRELYKGIPGFSPPLDIERRELLDPKRSYFFKRGTAAYFMAYDGEEPVGRISVQIDPLYPGGEANDVALFGCFDAVDDQNISNALIAAALRWAGQHGKTRMHGPYTLSTNMEPGILVEGGHAPPMLLAPWHPTYLAGHLERAGFRKIQDLHYYRIDKEALTNGPLSERLDQLPEDPKLIVRPMRLGALKEEAALACRLYNDGWEGNWGFVPLQTEEIHLVLREMKPLLHEDIGLVIEDAGEPVALAVVLPNIAEMVSDLGGAPTPIGWVKLLSRIAGKRVYSGRLAIMGIKRDYQGSRGILIMARLMRELRDRALRHKLATIEAGWIVESNRPLQRFINAMNLPRTRTYRIFERDLHV